MHSFSGLATLFAQVVLAVAFLASFLSKVRDLERFRRTVSAFAMVPPSWSALLARLLAAADGATVAALIGGVAMAGGGAPRWATFSGLLLALVLVAVYTVALALVRLRQTRVSCNCFGARTTTVSWYDVTRNLALLAVALVGLTQVPAAMTGADLALVIVTAVSAGLILINFADVAAMALSSAAD